MSPEWPLAIRRTEGDGDSLAELTRTLARDFEEITNARLHTGAFLAEAGWVSTLPLAVDRVGTRCRFGASQHRRQAGPLLVALARDETAGEVGERLLLEEPESLYAAGERIALRAARFIGGQPRSS